MDLAFSDAPNSPNVIYQKICPPWGDEFLFFPVKVYNYIDGIQVAADYIFPSLQDLHSNVYSIALGNSKYLTPFSSWCFAVNIGDSSVPLLIVSTFGFCSSSM